MNAPTPPTALGFCCGDCRNALELEASLNGFVACKLAKTPEQRATYRPKRKPACPEWAVVTDPR